jgi:superfamily II DNA or RNA helicase
MQLEPYQTRAVAAALQHLAQHPGGVLVAPTGGGKTWMCALVVRDGGYRRVLWCAPTQETRDQGKAACELWRVSDRVHVCCYQAEPHGGGYDLIIIDEGHRAWCNTIQQIVKQADPDCKLLGVTATPKRANAEEDIQAVIGPIFHTVPLAEVVGTGRIVRPGVWWCRDVFKLPEGFARIVEAEQRRQIKNNWWRIGVLPKEQKDAAIDELKRRVEYTLANEHGIRSNQCRNDKAAHMAKAAIAKGRIGLVLVQTKEQGAYIAGKIGTDAVEFYSGVKGRKGIVEATRAGEIKCLIGTSAADEGLDVPILSFLVMACGGKGAREVQQRTGRIMRGMPGKPDGIVCDFADTHHDNLKFQAFARARVYRKLGLATL